MSKIEKNVLIIARFISKWFADRKFRMDAIENCVETFYTETGNFPDTKTLDFFADQILYEDLVDDHPDKMTRDEYPIMSERQLMRRHQKETGLKNADGYDTNGHNRGKPARRKRSKYENTLVDLRTRSLNKERHRKYTEFTKKQPVKRYFLPK